MLFQKINWKIFRLRIAIFWKHFWTVRSLNANWIHLLNITIHYNSVWIFTRTFTYISLLLQFAYILIWDRDKVKTLYNFEYFMLFGRKYKIYKDTLSIHLKPFLCVRVCIVFILYLKKGKLYTFLRGVAILRKFPLFYSVYYLEKIKLLQRNTAIERLRYSLPLMKFSSWKSSPYVCIADVIINFIIIATIKN